MATEAWQADALAEAAASARTLGADVALLDAVAVRDAVHSPTYLAGLRDAAGCATVDPARLAWGLRRACLEAGVRIYEHTPVTGIASDGGPPGRKRFCWLPRPGEVVAEKVALGTGAFAPLLRRLRYYLVPVYDYVLMTEPLSAAQLTSVGWQDRAGVADSGNQFHYYRLTRDNRILSGRPARSTTTAAGSRPAWTWPPSRRWPGTSSGRSRSWRGWRSATRGAE